MRRPCAGREIGQVWQRSLGSGVGGRIRSRRVLFVRQVAGKRLWSLPGGKVDMKESLEEGLRRETFEEIGLKISSLEFIAMFDRPEKASLAFLYRVALQPGKMRFPKGEIETAAYFSALPPDCTPSARYFWNAVQAMKK